MRELTIIPDGALLLKNGLIDEVGPTSRVATMAKSRGAIEIDATGKVVMPGFVDAHTHLMFPLPHPADAVPGTAIDIDHDARTIVGITAQRLAGHGRGWLQAMARHGTTTLEAKSGCGPHDAAELKVLRVLGVLNKSPLDIVPTYLFRASTLDNAERVFSNLMLTLRRRRLARFADLQWDTDMSHRPLLVRFLETALSLGYGCKIHADHHNCGGAVALAAEYGVTSIDHLEYASLDHARILAAVGAIATLLPPASFRHGHDAPARTLIDAGVAIALGTNFNPAHTPSLSMQSAVSLACLQMGMTPAEAITAATINSAHALQIAKSVGTLEIDKLADILILDTSDYRDLGYQLGSNLVHTTIKRGEVLHTLGA
jgi:imidazolonepropionase